MQLKSWQVLGSLQMNINVSDGSCLDSAGEFKCTISVCEFTNCGELDSRGCRDVVEKGRNCD